MKLRELLEVINLTDNVVVTKYMDNRPIAQGYADKIFEELDDSILDCNVTFVHARDDIRHAIIIKIDEVEK